jgi:parallel beta-helix repeat protein
VQGIYLDDQMSGYEVYGNLIENCELGFMLGGGRDNLVHNNTYAFSFSFSFSVTISFSPLPPSFFLILFVLCVDSEEMTMISNSIIAV